MRAILLVLLLLYYLQHLNYSRIIKIGYRSSYKLEKLIYYIRTTSRNKILVDNIVFIPFPKDLSPLLLDLVVVVLRPRVYLISDSKT